MQASHLSDSQMQTTLKVGLGNLLSPPLYHYMMHLGVHAAGRTLCSVLRDAPCHLAHGTVELLTWRQLSRGSV